MVVHILLLILKTAGIVLLILLGLVLLLAALTLGTALKYQAEAEGANILDSIRAQGKFFWFFHLVSGYGTYRNGTLEWKLRIAWKTWESTGAEEPPEEEPLEEEPEPLPEREETPEPEEEKVLPKEEKAQPEEVKALPEPEEEPAQPEEERELPKPEEEKTENAPEREKSIRREKKHFLRAALEKGKQFYQAVLNFFRNIKYTFQRICDKIKALLKKKEKIQRFIENETHRQAFEKLKKEAGWLWRRIRPRRLDIRLHFGLDEPYHTGKALAVLAVLYPFLEGGLDVTPDFEQKVLEGRIFMQGKMRAVHFLIPAWRLFRDRQVRITYRRMKQMWQSMS